MHPSWHFTWCIMHVSYNIQPCHPTFPILNQWVAPRPVLTCFVTCIDTLQETGKIVWYSHLFRNFPQFVVIHTVKGFSAVSEAEVDVFSCFLHDPTNDGNLISVSSASSKPSLYMWKFLVHVLLKPSLKDFEHNLATITWEMNTIVW